VITRREVSLAGGLGVLVAHGPTLGQTTATIRRVGCIGVPTGHPLFEAFRQGMRELGWLEGGNVEYRGYAGGVVSQFDAQALELVNQHVDVIVAPNTQATRAAQRATTTVPIVMAGSSNAVGNGFIASLAKPGGNITGLSTQAEEVLSKSIEYLHEAAPAARRIAILLNETHPSLAVFWASAQATCAALDLSALRVVASAPAQFAVAVEQIASERSQAVVVIPDPLYYTERVKLQELMQTTRLPVAYGMREAVTAGGGLLSYTTNLPALFRSSAKWVDKILKGAKPADLPVEQPTNFELVINLKAAKALGLAVPQSLVLRANEVIE
jgi:putative tryptophan/tyrosine transport system substrate-binding protein